MKTFLRHKTKKESGPGKRGHEEGMSLKRGGEVPSLPSEECSAEGLSGQGPKGATQSKALRGPELESLPRRLLGAPAACLGVVVGEPQLSHTLAQVVLPEVALHSVWVSLRLTWLPSRANARPWPWNTAPPRSHLMDPLTETPQGRPWLISWEALAHLMEAPLASASEQWHKESSMR